MGALFFTHALVRSSSASDFGFGRREQEGGTIESETYRLEGERKILSSVPLNCECSGCFLEIKTLTVSFFWWNLRRFGALLVCFAAADALLSIALKVSRPLLQARSTAIFEP